MNYHSVVVSGTGEEVVDIDQKMEALRIVSERIWPGRWDEARIPTEDELKATKVIRIRINEGAAKIRTGPAKDDSGDYELSIWAGVVPVETHYMPPISDEKLLPGIVIPENVLRRRRV